jgi:hypothetical protein
MRHARLLASAGAIVVGMSTVPEVVAGRDEGIRDVLSSVTNMVVGVEQATHSRSVREELDAEVRNRNVLLVGVDAEGDRCTIEQMSMGTFLSFLPSCVLDVWLCSSHPE